MKKFFSMFLAFALMAALLCGCGVDTTETPEDAQTEAQSEAQAQQDPASGEETGEQTDPEKVPAAETEPVPVEKDGTAEIKDLYKLSDFAAESGGSYTYLTTTQPDAAAHAWQVPEGFTPLAVRMTVQNEGKEAVNFLEDLGCTIVTDKGNTYVATTMQENAGQTDKDGNAYPSVDAVPLEKGKSAVVWMIGNVPTDLVNSGEGLHAYFVLNDGTVYDIDLRDLL